jgi:hypothetical protein
MVQRSSILTYDEESKEGDRPRGGAVAALLRSDDRGGKFGAGEDETQHMNLSTLRRHHANLREAVAELYLGIKQKTKDENETTSPEDEREERDIIMSLDSYVIIEYIKSSVDIILNLKFEEIEKRLMDKNGTLLNDSSSNQILEASAAANSHSFKQNRLKGMKESGTESNANQTDRSSQSTGPPAVYEQLIQSLEADIRKHIRIEQQLKLHIESMENRIEELESQNEKAESENRRVKTSGAAKQREIDSRVKELEEQVRMKEAVLRGHEVSIKAMKEAETRFRKEIEHLKVVMEQSKGIETFNIMGQVEVREISA